MDGATAFDSGTSGSTAVGPSGGTMTGSGVSVTIPPGALDHAIDLSIAPIASPVAGSVGQAFDIGPTGTQFKVPVTIAFSYTAGELGGAAASTFAVSTVVGGTWQAIASQTVDTSGATISGTTMHLSPYALASIRPSIPDAGFVEAGAADAAAIGDGGCGSASVSFMRDVMPIFQTTCTLSSVCHGQMNNAAEEDLYLGENAGGASPSAVFGGLVGVRSKEDPSMNLVTAGSLGNSYLWHKLIGDQNTNAAVQTGCAQAPSQCADCTTQAHCGAQEPYLSAGLPADELCTIQSWIDEGAPNN
jgi:hypothetical protein